MFTWIEQGAGRTWPSAACSGPRSRARGCWPLPFALVAAACAPAASEPRPPDHGRSADLAALGAERPHVQPGEYLKASLAVMGVQAARAHATICGGEHAEPIRVALAGETTGPIGMLRRAVMELETELLPNMGVPRKNWAIVQLGTKERHYEVSFSHGLYAYQYTRNYGPPINGVVPVPGREQAFDFLSAIVALRTWRPDTDAVGTFHVVLGRHLWFAEVVFRGPDVVLLDGDPWPAMRVDGAAHKLQYDPEEKDPRRFSMWFSDDPDRIPLRASTESSFGDIWMEMSDYGHEGECSLAEDPGASAGQWSPGDSPPEP